MDHMGHSNTCPPRLLAAGNAKFELTPVVPDLVAPLCRKLDGYGRDGGGAEGIRTPGLLIANEALSQLSYSPVPPGADIAQQPW